MAPSPAAPQVDWRPAASLAAVRARAKMLAQCREFFAARSVLEVETPVLSRAGTTDPNIESLKLDAEFSAGMYLHTSPEFAMKRLLAAGSGDIYQICKVFRGDELGRLHNPEFTLLEWYREKFNLADLMKEVAELLGELLAMPSLAADAQFFSYRQLFEERVNLNPLEAGAASLLSCLQEHEIPIPVREFDCDVLLDLIMSAILLPGLTSQRLCFIYDYPISQAALARAHPNDPLLAKRFEAVYSGVELANGFEELSDAREQRARFTEDSRRRADKGAASVAIDEHLLAALAHGLGDYAGVAVGLDRVLMLALGASHIEDVLCFPVTRC